MSFCRDNNYAKTDFDFSTAKGVIGGVYCILMVLIVLGALGGLLLLVQRDGASAGLTTIVSCIVSGMILHVAYSFLIGFFELIKHAREIRNELAALRAKSGASMPEPVAMPHPAASAGATRYDSATHQYVKA